LSTGARACLLLVILFAAWDLPRRAAAAPLADPATEPGEVVLYLARRGWHIDVGFAARDLDPSLAFIAPRFPHAKYLFFGFGDRHYLLSKGKDTSTLVGALFPGRGLILVTAIENSPVQAFGAPHVLEFALPAPQAAAAQLFVRRALAGVTGSDDAAADRGAGATNFPVVAEGPYEGSVYYGAVARYSALHTCNTWAAEALKSAGLDVHAHFVVFAGQTWNQARRAQNRALLRSRAPEGVLAPGPISLNRREADCRSDRPLSSSSPAEPPPWSLPGEAGSSC
jgi:Protein of unknown function (DUF2459)